MQYKKTKTLRASTQTTRRSRTLRILGIDPGYDRCGVAVVEVCPPHQEKILFSDCIRPSNTIRYSARLLRVGTILDKLLVTWKPSAVAVETLYFAKNKKTAAKISEVRGMVVYLAAARGMPIYEFTPLEVKAAITGYGTAPKHRVAEALHQRIHLPHNPTYDDEYDAIAIALTGLYTLINTLSTKTRSEI